MKTSEEILLVVKEDRSYKSLNADNPLVFDIENNYAYVKNTCGRLAMEVNKNNIQEIRIPSKILFHDVEYPVKSIQVNSFSFCTALKEIIIPNTIEIIEQNSFMNCTSLTQIILPPSLKKIGSGAFEGCHDLKQLTIPSSVQSIGDGAFAHIDVSISNYSPNYSIFDGDLYNRDKSQLLYVLKSKMGIYNVLPNVKIIGKSAFEDCKYLTQINLLESIEKIGESAFENCLALSKIELPRSLKTIDKYTFFDCDGLRQITIPYNIKKIEDYAFGWCANLQEIWIQNSSCDYTKADIPSYTKVYVGNKKRYIL